MTYGSIVALMYHELEQPNRTLCHSEPGYVRYVVAAENFEAQMESLRDQGWHGITVTEALSLPNRACVALTFDDGCETDLVVAAPLLRDLGFGATFFITTGFLNTPGFLSSTQLKQLCDAGFEIGCHSQTHAYLPDLDDKSLEREMLDPKKELENLVGKPIEHFSCPGGRYNRRVRDMAVQFGYRTVSTSRTHANSRSTDRYALGRATIMRTTSLKTFQNLCRNKGLARVRVAEMARSAAKSLLGNTSYDRLRALVLRRDPSGK